MKVFIGSAGESKSTVNLIKSLLIEIGIEATAWFDIGVFIASLYTMENLERLTEEYDAAIFIYSEDDSVVSKDTEYKATRDNVILETGLFSGKLGHKKVLVCIEGSPKIPTDQWGLTTVKINQDNINRTKQDLQVWINSIKDTQTKSNCINMFPRHINDIVFPIEERWKYAKEITFVNYASTAFIAAAKAVPDHVISKSLRDLYLNKIKSGCNFKFLVTEPNTFADFDASLSKMKVIPRKGVCQSNIISLGLEGLKNDYTEFYKNGNSEYGDFEFATTDIALPYALLLVTNDENHSNLDHIKVDLYSPFLSDDNMRRSFIIYKDNENFLFFRNQVTELWTKAINESQINPDVIPKIISSKEIKSALNKNYRQYLVGDLKKAQPLLEHIYDKKLEFGMTYYKDFTVDQPHFHTFATEYIYVMKGEYKLCVKMPKKVEYKHLKKGDLCVIPKLTKYASKACPKTQILFIKSPSINDKVDCNDFIFDDFKKIWEN